MRTRYIIATILIFIGFIIHTVGGELTDMKFLMISDMPVNIKIEIRAVWYLLSIDFLISGIFLTRIIFKKSIAESKLLIDFIGIRMILYGMIFLLMIVFLKFKLFQVPQWILLFCIGLLLEWNYIKRIVKG